MASSGGAYNTGREKHRLLRHPRDVAGETTHPSAPLRNPHYSIGQYPSRIPAHHKVMAIDGETGLTGSFNFARAAEQKKGKNYLAVRDRPPERPS